MGERILRADGGPELGDAEADAAACERQREHGDCRQRQTDIDCDEPRVIHGARLRLGRDASKLPPGG